MIKFVIIKSYVFLRKLPLYLFILFIIIFNFVISTIIYFIGIDLNTEKIFGSTSFTTLILLACIISPLFETFLFQYLPMELFKNRFKKKTSIRIVLSSIMFSLGHRYNFYYMIVTFFMGLSFAIAYVIQRKKNEKAYAFLTVYFIHFLWNLFIILTWL